VAYEIQKKQYGFYVAIEFEGEGPIPNTLEHEYNFNDKVLRYLTYRYTKNKLKAREKQIEAKITEPQNLEIEETESTPKTEDPKPVENGDEKPVNEEVENA